MSQDVKVFGLEKLEEAVAKRRKIDLGTVQVVLEVLDIPNVAESEAMLASHAAGTEAAAAEEKAEELSREAAVQRSLADSARNRERTLDDLAKVAKRMTGK